MPWWPMLMEEMLDRYPNMTAEEIARYKRAWLQRNYYA